MSSNAIRIRFERLKKNGVITGSITQVNPKKLGYGCLAFLLIKAEANEETEVYDFVQKVPNIGCFKPIGRYNIQCIVALKNVDELAQTVEQISSHPNVLDVQEAILVDAVRMDHPENLTIEPTKGLPYTETHSENKNPKHTTNTSYLDKAVKENGSEKTEKLEDIDMSIIEILSDNASMSFRKIAKKLGISTQYVIKRYRRLQNTALPFSSITVNLKKLGYKGIALFAVKTSHKSTTSKVFDAAVRIPNVIVAHKCVGAMDMYLVCPFIDITQLLEVKQQICNTPGVKEIELFIDEPFSSWPLNLFTQHIFKKSN